MRGIALMRLLVVLVAVMPASAAAAQDAVVGTWRGSAEEFSSPLRDRLARTASAALSLVRGDEVIYGTALTPLPEGRAATVSIALTHASPSPVASRRGL